MSLTLSKLRDRCVDEIRSLHAGASNRAWTSEEQQKFDALSAQVEDIDLRLGAVEVAGSAAPRSLPASRQRGMWSSASSILDDSAVLRSWLRVGSPMEQRDDREVLSRAGHVAGASSLEFRALGKSATAGLETVPQSLFDTVSRTLASYAPVRSVASIIKTDGGENLKVPTCDDTSNLGAIVAENAENTALDMTFSEVSLGAYKYSSRLVRVSNELLNDTGVDLVRFIGEVLGERIGRAQSAHFLTGTGSSQPQGLLVGGTAVSAAGATTLVYNDLVNLLVSINPAYLADGGTGSVAWMMSPSIFGVLRKLSDSAGNPLLQPMSEGGPARLFGYPVVLVTEMASSIVAGAKSILFGNYRQYAIRDAGNLIVSRSGDRFFEYDQQVFLAFYRTDAKVLQSGAIKYLLHPTPTTTTTP
jgi:HK97 family phage major capsid protein